MQIVFVLNVIMLSVVPPFLTTVNYYCNVFGTVSLNHASADRTQLGPSFQF